MAVPSRSRPLPVPPPPGRAPLTPPPSWRCDVTNIYRPLTPRGPPRCRCCDVTSSPPRGRGPGTAAGRERERRRERGRAEVSDGHRWAPMGTDRTPGWAGTRSGAPRYLAGRCSEQGGVPVPGRTVLGVPGDAATGRWVLGAAGDPGTGHGGPWRSRGCWYWGGRSLVFGDIPWVPGGTDLRYRAGRSLEQGEIRVPGRMVPGTVGYPGTLPF